jgi:hypothetical protein
MALRTAWKEERLLKFKEAREGFPFGFQARKEFL